MNYSNIKNYDISNGPGVRVSLFVSGCLNHCPGCFNKDTWDFNFGKPFDKSTEDYLIKLLDNDSIDGLTILGGDPFEVSNQHALVDFIINVRSKFPDKSIWMYTGYTYDELRSIRHTDVTDTILSNINVLVDGRFIKDKCDVELQYRGSSNQRILTLVDGEIKSVISNNSRYN